jgi:hypothetical protein
MQDSTKLIEGDRSPSEIVILFLFAHHVFWRAVPRCAKECIACAGIWQIGIGEGPYNTEVKQHSAFAVPSDDNVVWLDVAMRQTSTFEK